MYWCSFPPLLFRWLNTLGMLANQGIDVVIRHSFFDHGYNHLVDQNFNPLPVSEIKIPSSFSMSFSSLDHALFHSGRIFLLLPVNLMNWTEAFLTHFTDFWLYPPPPTPLHVHVHTHTHIYIYRIYYYNFKKSCAVEIPHLLVACLNSAWEWIFPDCFL